MAIFSPSAANATLSVKAMGAIRRLADITPGAALVTTFFSAIGRPFVAESGPESLTAHDPALHLVLSTNQGSQLVI